MNKTKRIIIVIFATVIILASIIILMFVFQENDVAHRTLCAQYSIPFEEFFARRPYIVSAKFVEKRWHLNCTEYVFEITEVLKGNLNQKEISTYERKLNWFQKSDLEIWLEARGIYGYIVGEEYLLTPYLPEDSERLLEGWGNYIPLNDLESAYYTTQDFLNRFTTYKIENPTRDEFITFLKGIIEEYSVADEHEYPEGPISLPSDNRTKYIVIACCGAGVVVLSAALITCKVVSKKRKRKLPPE